MTGVVREFVEDCRTLVYKRTCARQLGFDRKDLKQASVLATFVGMVAMLPHFLSQTRIYELPKDLVCDSAPATGLYTMTER